MSYSPTYRVISSKITPCIDLPSRAAFAFNMRAIAEHIKANILGRIE